MSLWRGDGCNDDDYDPAARKAYHWGTIDAAIVLIRKDTLCVCLRVCALMNPNFVLRQNVMGHQHFEISGKMYIKAFFSRIFHIFSWVVGTHWIFINAITTRLGKMLPHALQRWKCFRPSIWVVISETLPNHSFLLLCVLFSIKLQIYDELMITELDQRCFLLQKSDCLFFDKI